MFSIDGTDIRDLVTGLISHHLTKLLPPVLAAGKQAIKSANARMRDSYTDYILSAAYHYGNARTFFIRDTKKPLYNYYVPLDLSVESQHSAEATVRALVACGNRAVINGRAGCGKSTIMRHLFIDSMRDKERIPIFFELSQLNNRDLVDLWEGIHQSMQKHQFSLSLEQLKHSVSRGGFTLLLDGLDEVQETHRRETISQIEQIAAVSSDNLIVVSSRPDESTLQLAGFTLFEVQPLSIEKAEKLIELIPFDEEIKRKFSIELRASLYRKHSTFLANPLLLSIMLLTYGQSASIPNRITVFYNQAYEALFQTHDAYKGGFSRKRSTNLDIQEFERAFSALCLLSYHDAKTTFSRMDCLDVMKRAQPLAAVDYKPDQLLADCLQSVCLLMEDGLNITFVHRSFQEYFAAKCATRQNDQTKKSLISRFSARGLVDGFVDCFWELDQRACESLWLLPEIVRLRQDLNFKKKLSVASYLSYIRLLADVIVITSDGGQLTRQFRTRVDFDTPEYQSLRCAIFLVYRRYWASQFDVGLHKACDQRKVSEPIRIVTSQLRARSYELEALRSLGWVFGWEFVTFLLNLPDQITRKKDADLGSIYSMLNISPES